MCSTECAHHLVAIITAKVCAIITGCSPRCTMLSRRSLAGLLSLDVVQRGLHQIDCDGLGLCTECWIPGLLMYYAASEGAKPGCCAQPTRSTDTKTAAAGSEEAPLLVAARCRLVVQPIEMLRCAGSSEEMKPQRKTCRRVLQRAAAANPMLIASFSFS